MSIVLQPGGRPAEVEHCTAATMLLLASVINADSVIWAATNVIRPAVGRAQPADGGS